MPIFENIPKYSFIPGIFFFLKKKNFLKFWHLFLELIYAKPTTLLQYKYYFWNATWIFKKSKWLEIFTKSTYVVLESTTKVSPQNTNFWIPIGDVKNCLRIYIYFSWNVHAHVSLKGLVAWLLVMRWSKGWSL
jgi:hypothetical protein